MTVATVGQRKKPQQVQPYRWTRQEYDKMIEIGLFSPEARLELIEGEILEMASHTSYHAAALTLMARWLDRVFREGYHVRNQLSLALSEDSEPEPDLAVVSGSPEEYWHEHPHTATLIVEIAYSSLDYDQERKRRLYARSYIPEYWILNLNEHQLEVYREPQQGDYAIHLTYTSAERVAPIAYPEQQIPVADFLPH